MSRNSSHSSKRITSRSSLQRGRISSTVASIGLPLNSEYTAMPAALDCVSTYSTSCSRKAGLTVTKISPASAAPNSIMIHSGMLGAHTATRSPGSNLRSRAWAVRTDSAYSSAYVHCRRAVGSGTPAIRATRSGVVAAAHASNPPSVSSRSSG